MEKLPDVYNYDFEASGRPWNENNGANRDQYFNYGLNE